MQLKSKVLFIALAINSLFDLSSGQRVCNTEYEWTCDNGECIDNAEKCNGSIQCSDNSDETAEHCIGQEGCSAHAYRCTYGACIRNSRVCNGKWDCADGSDELPILCKDNTMPSLQGHCRSKLHFQCLSGECIGLSDLCDGWKNCPDESDEIVHVCAARACPPFSFRCGYGACIDNDLKCNGVRNCLDGSDEATSICGYRVKPSRTPNRNLTSVVNNAAKCKLDIQDNNLVMRDTSRKIIESDEVAINTIVDFTCKIGYFLEGAKTVLCTLQGWNTLLPKCLKYCSRQAIVQGVSTRARCVYNGEQVDCDDRIRPQTEAQITCAYGFRMDPTTDFPEQLNCLENGEWDAQRGFCVMKCGQVVQEVTKFSTGGTSVDITEAPWQVAIYSSFGEEKFRYRCGGSIISPSMVISAAHCFWDERRAKLIDKSNFFVAAGKTFQDYKKHERTEEFRNISKINIHSDYRDLENNYAYDLAVVILDRSLSFSYSIYPLCNPRLDNAQQYVESNMTGWFAGWGITEDGLTSTDLQSVGTNTLSFTDCQMEVKKREPKYVLSSDKFCLYDPWGVRSACKGDSGSGFVMPQNTDQVQTFRLVGVISHTPIRQRDCAEDGLVTVTNVQFLRELIQSSMKFSRTIDAKFEPTID